MAIKLRLKDVRPHDYLSDDAQFNCEIEAFDDVTGRVIDRGNLVYSGAALSKMTATEVRARLRDDALAWAADRKAAYAATPAYQTNVKTMANLQALVGAEVAVP